MYELQHGIEQQGIHVCPVLTKLLASLHGVDNIEVKTIDFLCNRDDAPIFWTTDRDGFF